MSIVSVCESSHETHDPVYSVLLMSETGQWKGNLHQFLSQHFAIFLESHACRPDNIIGGIWWRL